MRKTVGLAIAYSVLLFAAAGCNTIQANDKQADNEGSEGALYENEVISFVVPYQAGGGSDVFARFMANYFSKHIEGSPGFKWKISLEEAASQGPMNMHFRGKRMDEIF